MKLQSIIQSNIEKLNEFDLWITPTLVEIKDTKRYQEEMESTQRLIEVIGTGTNDFASLSDLNLNSIVDAILNTANAQSHESADKFIEYSASLLFLVTGKSDNNAKCQFPIFLRDVSQWDKIPSVEGKKIVRKEIPRVLKSSQISGWIAKLKDFPDAQRQFFMEYVKFVLDAPEYVNSLWAIGNSYFKMKAFGLQSDFLMPLVIFKVRGSVSASGGHEPEDLLRKVMKSWGMIADLDFNIGDVIVEGHKPTEKTKTRAFDFVLPYKVPGWRQRIFIQCQFYAGDSGSVSHKNVDQTRSSRDYNKQAIADAIFIEYLDGAGYYSSLNGDLRSILAMKDTYDFFQVRTAPIKLRRALQTIGFLTPLEIVHALGVTKFMIEPAKLYLQKQGYSPAEIERAFKQSIANGFIQHVKNSAEVSEELLETSRVYFLLDIIFMNARPIADNMLRGFVLIPGLNGISGVKLSSIVDHITEVGGYFAEYYSRSTNLMKALGDLSANGYILQK